MERGFRGNSMGEDEIGSSKIGMTQGITRRFIATQKREANPLPGILVPTMLALDSKVVYTSLNDGRRREVNAL